MSCFHPLKAFAVGLTDSGATQYKICSIDAHHVELVRGLWHQSNSEVVWSGAERTVSDFIYIPCGRCIGCRIDYSRQWANRCMLELQYHDSAYFVTLTYDDNHLPLSYSVDKETGEVAENATLDKRDFQLFMKRLRKNTGQKIRFFAAGEYGSETFRPHYHAILFGLKLNDLVYLKSSPTGDKYYTSKTISDAWQNRGHVLVCDVTWETCAYVARYVTKKLGGSLADFYDTFNIQPEFSLMSRKPGIARQYYDDHKDELYNFDFINISTEKGGRKFRPPKYYNSLYDIDYPEKSAELKIKRQELASALNEARLEGTDLIYKDYLQVLEDKFKARAADVLAEHRKKV